MHARNNLKERVQQIEVLKENTVKEIEAKKRVVLCAQKTVRSSFVEEKKW